MKFDFFKSEQDLLNKFQYLYTRLDKLLEINRYQLELLLSLSKKVANDESLAEQVDDFYETPPQTEQVTRDGD